MKVLKSGVEMTPEEMRKSRGGMCACGCGVGVNSMNSTTQAEDGSSCQCGCEPDRFEIVSGGTWAGAWAYVWLY